MAKRKMKAWADVGSHGHIFMFDIGPIADRYPKLLNIYAEKVTPDLVPVEITYEFPERSKARGSKS